MSTIELVSISKTFVSHSNSKTILDNVSFTFKTNHIYVLKGPSGSGKSTLLSLIGLLDTPTSGQIIIDGIEYSSKSRREKFNFTSKNVSYLFQGINLILNLTCFENLMLVNTNENLIMQIMQELQIQHLIDKKAHLISKGEKARLAMARCILEGKPFMLLDEPCANLDKASARIALSVIAKYAYNKIIIIISHQYNERLPFPYYLLRIQNKGIVSEFMNEVEIKRENKPQVSKEKGNHLLSTWFKTTLSLFFASKIKSLILILSNSLLLFIILIASSIFIYDSNKIISTKLLESNIHYVRISHPKDYQEVYRYLELPFMNQETKIVLTSFYSINNTFQFNNQVFNLNEGEMILPQYIASQFSLAKNDTLLLDTIEVKIVDVYEDNLLPYATELAKYIDQSALSESIALTVPAFVNMDIVQNYLYTKDVTVDRFQFSDLTKSLKEKTGFSIDVSSLKLSTSQELKETEVSLVLSEYLPSNYEDVVNQLIGRQFSLTTGLVKDTFDMNSYIHEMTIKDISYSDQLNSLEAMIIVNNSVSRVIIDELFINGYGSDNYFMLPSTNFTDTDFTSVHLDSFGLINQSEYEMLQAIDFLEEWSMIVGLIVIVLEMIMFTYILDGQRHAYRDSNNLFFTLGWKSPKRNLIFVFPLLISLLFSLVISIVVFTIYGEPLNRLISKMLGALENLHLVSLNLLFWLYFMIGNILLGYILSYFYTFIDSNKAFQEMKKKVI